MSPTKPLTPSYHPGKPPRRRLHPLALCAVLWPVFLILVVGLLVVLDAQFPHTLRPLGLKNRLGVLLAAFPCAGILLGTLSYISISRDNHAWYGKRLALLALASAIAALAFGWLCTGTGPLFKSL